MVDELTRTRGGALCLPRTSSVPARGWRAFLWASHISSIIRSSGVPTFAICRTLFVDKHHRGSGVGRALFEKVARRAQQRNCSRLYWHTRANKATARRLYDSLAAFDGFIRYERQL
jgi:GNAT superfamily N-acetyltransferase